MLLLKQKSFRSLGVHFQQLFHRPSYFLCKICNYKFWMSISIFAISKMEIFVNEVFWHFVALFPVVRKMHIYNNQPDWHAKHRNHSKSSIPVSNCHKTICKPMLHWSSKASISANTFAGTFAHCYIYQNYVPFCVLFSFADKWSSLQLIIQFSNNTFIVLK